MAADNPPQYMWFPFKGFICCKHFLHEICHDGESWCRMWLWSIPELAQAVCGEIPHPWSAPSAAHRAPRGAWLQAATPAVGGSACSNWEPLPEAFSWTREPLLCILEPLPCLPSGTTLLLLFSPGLAAFVSLKIMQMHSSLLFTISLNPAVRENFFQWFSPL